MKHSNIAVFSLLLTSALAGFAQAQTVTLNSAPSRGVGQPQLFPESGSANRVEGREFFSPQGVALDNTTSSTPILYVADLRNNRVLAWKNSTGFGNGAPADLVIGQPDMFSTSALGPGTLYPTGLTAPTGIAVYKGDLYVADAGNNRVLRYPKPFSQQGPITPDLWIGQPNLNSRTANWTGQVSEKGVFLSSSNNVFQSGIAFDASGNLWIGDPGNVRVLRYPAGSITCSSCTASADIVIGQPNLTTVTTPPLPSTLTGFKTKNQFGLIDALAFDSTGRLYVTDQVGSGSTANGRVLVFSSPSSQTGNLSADRIMGVIDISQLSGLDQNALQVFEGQTFLLSPGGVFLLADNSVGVVDTTLNRITIFPPYEQWPAESKYFSPQASSVIGQTGFLVPGNTFPNAVGPGFSSAGTPPPSASTLYGPTSAVFLPATKELFISDSTNNRVIVMPQTTGTNFGAGTRVLGQDKMTQYSINLIEGKEFNFFVSQSYGDAAIALDTSGPAPHLWVSDPHNHRVLGFADARKLGPATKADIVLGQPDFGSALCNYPSGDVNSPSQSSLCLPTGLAVDAGGNLYVADSLNGRVLRFPNPWAYTGPAPEPADLVLGQSNFNNSVRQPTASTMGSPYGLAFSGTSGLVVADPGYNRIVFIPFSANGTFTAGLDNGKAATKFFGQPDFKTITSGSATNQLNGPRGIACDTSGQIYVADANNNRVEIFGDPNNPQTTAFANLTLPSLNSPRSIYVNSGTGEIWVTNTGAGTLVRYPKYDALFLNPAPTATIQDVLNNTLIPTYAVAQDQYGDLVVADAANHVIAFYQGFTAVNAATSLARPLAPGVLATLYPAASATQFGANTATNSSTTWPTALGDIQVTWDGHPAPLNYVSPGQINVFAPNETSVNTYVEVEVAQVSTGQVLGAQQVPVSTIAPGIFTSCQANQTGNLREACVLNEDSTVNTSTNPAARGSVVQIFATGQGLVSNAPADGAPAPSSEPLARSLATPRVIMNTCFTDDCGAAQPGDVGTSGSHSGSWVSYSGLAPGFVGLWQINAQIPMAVPPSSSTGGVTILAVQLNGQGSTDTTSGFRTFFYVK